jgi:hypothetical protein
MLRGLLNWGREGSEKSVWVIHRVGLSLRGNGMGTRLEGLPYPILMPKILYLADEILNLSRPPWAVTSEVF